MDPDDEVEIILHANEDASEITLVLKRKRPMTTMDVCTELEFLAHELSRADDQLNQPGVLRH